MASVNCQKNQDGIAIVKEESRNSLASTEKEKPRKRIVKKRGEMMRITQVDSKKYAHGFGEKYPGLVVGHDSCKGSNGMVPKYMGWLWNVETLGIKKVRKGWCPGAISKPIDEMMQQFLNPYPCQTQNTFCDNKNDPNASSQTSVHDLTSTNSLDKKSKENICDRCLIKESRDMDTQYDINDIGDIFSNDIINKNEIVENAEATNQKRMSGNSEIIIGKITSSNKEDTKENNGSVVKATINNNRKSVFKQTNNENRKSVFKGSKNENRKSVFKGSENENKKSVFKGFNKEKELIEKTMNLEQSRKSTANQKDLDDKTPRKSKFKEWTSVQGNATIKEPRNTPNQCSTQCYNPCQNYCANINVCHWNTLQSECKRTGYDQTNSSFCKNPCNFH